MKKKGMRHKLLESDHWKVIFRKCNFPAALS